MCAAFIYEWTKCVCFLTPVCPCSSLQINAFQASMVLFIGKAWGAVTDPVVGFFITKSRWTKIGRLMPWWAPCSHYKVTPLNSPCVSTIVSFVLFYLFYHISKFRFFHWLESRDRLHWQNIWLIRQNFREGLLLLTSRYWYQKKIMRDDQLITQVSHQVRVIHKTDMLFSSKLKLSNIPVKMYYISIYLINTVGQNCPLFLN